MAGSNKIIKTGRFSERGYNGGSREKETIYQGGELRRHDLKAEPEDREKSRKLPAIIAGQIDGCPPSKFSTRIYVNERSPTFSRSAKSSRGCGATSSFDSYCDIQLNVL